VSFMDARQRLYSVAVDVATDRGEELALTHR
jgi:hypothetical protein